MSEARIGSFDRVLAFLGSELGWLPSPPGLPVFWVFPCYRCEIPDRMPLDEFQLMLGKGFLRQLIDWSRAPQPFVRVRCSSPEFPSPVRRFSRMLSVSRFSYEAQMLEQCTPPDVEIEIGNVKGEVLTFRGHVDGVLVGDGPTPVPRSRVAEALRTFLVRD